MRILSPNPALPATGGIWEGRESTFSQYLHAHFILPTSFVSFTIAPHYLTPFILGSFDYFDPLLRSSCGERAKERGRGSENRYKQSPRKDYVLQPGSTTSKYRNLPNKIELLPHHARKGHSLRSYMSSCTYIIVEEINTQLQS